MSIINRPPLGLQELLGSQNFGDNPKQLGGVVAPTLDMLPFYGSGILRMKRVSGSLASEGEITSIEFSDKVAVLSVAAFNEALLLANGQSQLGLFISGPPSDNLPVDFQHCLATGPGGTGATSAIGTAAAVAYSFPFPLVVEPGTAFHVHWLANSASQLAVVQLSVLFYDLSESRA